MAKNHVIRDEAHWHEFRSKHVGASEVASLFDQWVVDGEVVTLHAYEKVPADAMYVGHVGYKPPQRLYLEKRGELMPEDLGSFERVVAGKHLEAGIASWAAEKWPDWKLRKVRRYISDEKIPGWGASLDYEVHGEGMPPVEIKNVDGLIFKNQFVVEDGVLIEAPLKFLIQLQSQIGVVGSSHGWLVVCAGGNELHRMRVDRHQPTIMRIREAVAAFWAGVGIGFFPEDHVQYELQAEVSRYGEKDVLVASEDPKIPYLVGRYQRWKDHLARVEKHVDHLKGKLVAHLGNEGTVLVHPTNTIKWPRIVREEKVIPERIQAAMTYRGAVYISETKQPKAKKAKKESK